MDEIDEAFLVQDREFKLGENILYRDDEFTIIRHPRPMSKHHYVLAPNSPKHVSLRDLNRNHVDMIRRMTNAMKKGLRENGPSHTRFRIGFPAGMSAYRIHLHAISDDLYGEFIKSAEHWNAVSTDYFVKADKVIVDIESRGKVTLPTDNELTNLLDKDVQCHRCEATFEQFKDLNDHVTKHHQKKRDKPASSRRRHKTPVANSAAQPDDQVEKTTVPRSEDVAKKSEDYKPRKSKRS